MNFDDNTETPDDLFDFDPSQNQFINNRITTRCLREDIKATLCKKRLFHLGRETPVDLIDISSKGVLVLSNQKFSIHDKVTLKLEFDSGKTFEIKAAVVRKSTPQGNNYGIKFDRYNDELGDYLFETQKKLVFK
jgi:hypothetical protein